MAFFGDPQWFWSWGEPSETSTSGTYTTAASSHSHWFVWDGTKWELKTYEPAKNENLGKDLAMMGGVIPNNTFIGLKEETNVVNMKEAFNDHRAKPEKRADYIPSAAFNLMAEISQQMYAFCKWHGGKYKIETAPHQPGAMTVWWEAPDGRNMEWGFLAQEGWLLNAAEHREKIKERIEAMLADYREG